MDVARISDPHLQLLLSNVMFCRGIPAEVYPVDVFPNALAEVNPEYVVSEEKIADIKVLLSKPVEGLRISDFISLSDKIETEYRVITNAVLEERQYVLVKWPDDKKMTLRITECNVYHAQSTVFWFYKAIAV